MARRVQEVIADEKPDTQLGSLDISLYRDDLNRLDKMPSLESSDIPFDVDGAHVIIFDEVIYTGRTVRAAIEGILDYGRPSKIELAAFIDRGHRELPIQPDFVGHHLETALGQHVQVRLQEDDGEDAVYLRDAKDHPIEP